MTLITPSGNSNFSWSPKLKGLSKTASTGTSEKSDKDVLFDIAQRLVKAQSEKIEEIATDEKPEEKEEEKAESEKQEETDITKDKPCDEPPCDNKDKVDVQKAVQELVDKSNKAEEIAQKVGDVAEKIEQAVQEIKEVADVANNAIEGDAVVTDLPSNEVEEVEIEIEDVDSISDDKPIDMPGEELIKESNPMADIVASGENDFVKLSSISPETRKKVISYWQDYLGFPSDYVKLMAKNYEK